MVSISVATLLIPLLIDQLQTLAFIVMLWISLSPNHLWNTTGNSSTTMVSQTQKPWEGFVLKNTLCALSAAFLTPGSLYWPSLLFYVLLLLFLFLLFFTTLRKEGEIINSGNAFSSIWFGIIMHTHELWAILPFPLCIYIWSPWGLSLTWLFESLHIGDIW